MTPCPSYPSVLSHFQRWPARSSRHLGQGTWAAWEEQGTPRVDQVPRTNPAQGQEGDEVTTKHRSRQHGRPRDAPCQQGRCSQDTRSLCTHCQFLTRGCFLTMSLCSLERQVGQAESGMARSSHRGRESSSQDVMPMASLPTPLRWHCS